MFIGSALKDKILKIMPVQKQTRAGQRTRFKAFVGKHTYIYILHVINDEELRALDDETCDYFLDT